jgi:hypothetical protein
LNAVKKRPLFKRLDRNMGCTSSEFPLFDDFGIFHFTGDETHDSEGCDREGV